MKNIENGDIVYKKFDTEYDMISLVYKVVELDHSSSYDKLQILYDSVSPGDNLQFIYLDIKAIEDELYRVEDLEEFPNYIRKEILSNIMT